MPNSLRCKIKHLCHNGTLTERERDRILKALEREPKIGHWIFKDDDDQACLIYTCNKCGEQITILDDTIKSPQEGHYNYCPNCGAKMESEVEE